MEDEGIKVIKFDTKEYDYLTERDYVADDDLHLSAKARKNQHQT